MSKRAASSGSSRKGNSKRPKMTPNTQRMVKDKMINMVDYYRFPVGQNGERWVKKGHHIIYGALRKRNKLPTEVVVGSHPQSYRNRTGSLYPAEKLREHFKMKHLKRFEEDMESFIEDVHKNGRDAALLKIKPFPVSLPEFGIIARMAQMDNNIDSLPAQGGGRRRSARRSTARRSKNNARRTRGRKTRGRKTRGRKTRR